ncbi:hypothetical protein J6590_037424, partial [Homalodisca vitripennis]
DVGSREWADNVLAKPLRKIKTSCSQMGGVIGSNCHVRVELISPFHKPDWERCAMGETAVDRQPSLIV